MLTQVSGLSEAWVSSILLLFGVGMFLGNPIGGRLADRSLRAAVPITLTALILVLALTALVMAWALPMVVAVFLFGVALFATLAPLQMQVMAQAAEAPVLSSAFNIGAFNLGNAAGAYAGSLALEQGLALRTLPWVGVAISRCGLALALLPRSARRLETGEA
jgi:DHA1 family inner membrane transport protein